MLVKLTGPNGADIFVNPAHVIAILDDDADGTAAFCYVFVATVATKLRIVGTSDEVAAKLGFSGSLGPDPSDATRCDAIKAVFASDIRALAPSEECLAAIPCELSKEPLP